LTARLRGTQIFTTLLAIALNAYYPYGGTQRTYTRMKILITGGAGFIGSAVIRLAIKKGIDIVNVDCLTYAANEANLESVSSSPHYTFEKINICDSDDIRKCLNTHKPDAIMHLAAESHVDRSIDGPGAFIQTNVIGTFNLLQESRQYWDGLTGSKKEAFRFHHVSTDEVYGDLTLDGPAFTEETPYDPSSPYSASKAASDHLVRAWERTYGLPVLITNSSNNYGPYQFPEKLIPVVILKALHGEPIPVYGKGDNIRDWLYVDDHADALLTVLHKIKNELDWEPTVQWNKGFEQTIDWYLQNEGWWRPLIKAGMFGQRLGTKTRA